MPLELNLDRTNGLRIRWSDGSESTLPLRALRQHCPCATCRDQREQQARNPLRVLNRPPAELEMVTPTHAELVGRYALKIEWGDGHATGLYDFAMLRQLGEAQGAKNQAP